MLAARLLPLCLLPTPLLPPQAWSSDAGIGTLRIALGTLSIVAPAAVMMRLAHRASPGYLRRRTLYVLLLRTLRSATSFLGYRDVYSLAGIHSLALPPGLGMAAVHLLRWVRHPCCPRSGVAP